MSKKMAWEINFELKQDLSTKHVNLPATTNQFMKVVSAGAERKQNDFDSGQGILSTGTQRLCF